jgi:hypothetical protein
MFTKQATLMRRLSVLSVPLHLAFPESTFEAMLNSSSLLTERQAQETENWHQRYETFFFFVAEG